MTEPERLSLAEWLVLCLVREEPTYGLVLVGLLSLLGQMMARPNPLGLACTGFLGLLGLLAILQGVRTLSRPGKV